MSVLLCVLISVATLVGACAAVISHEPQPWAIRVLRFCFPVAVVAVVYGLASELWAGNLVSASFLVFYLIFASTGGDKPSRHKPPLPL